MFVTNNLLLTKICSFIFCYCSCKIPRTESPAQLLISLLLSFCFHLRKNSPTSIHHKTCIKFLQNKLYLKNHAKIINKPQINDIYLMKVPLFNPRDFVGKPQYALGRPENLVVDLMSFVLHTPIHQGSKYSYDLKLITPNFGGYNCCYL